MGHRAAVTWFSFCALAWFTASAALAQPARVPGTIAQDLRSFTETPAVPGNEGQLAAEIRSRLESYSPRTDRLGDVLVTVGSGAPHRLVAAPMDEPGYVVSRITAEGYLQLQRLPQFGLLPLFNELYSAEPVRIETASGKWIPGVVAGLSVHLMPGRTHPPDPDDIANMYVDVGAQSAAEARTEGADVLSPVAVDRTVYEMGFGNWTAPAIGDRFGDAALVELLRRLDPAKLHGTLTVAFLAQQWTGARGLQRVLQDEKPDELIYVGRMIPGEAFSSGQPQRRFPRRAPGSGVLVAAPQNSSALVADLERAATSAGVPVVSDYSAALIPRSYLPPPPMPARFAHLGIAAAWPSTPAEVIDASDLSDLAELLEHYYQGTSQKAMFPEARAITAPPLPARPQSAPSPEYVVKTLTETYGVSEHEGRVRETVERLLPPWAKTTTDAAGNLILPFAPAGASNGGILFVAHMDEIGYKVASIREDGRLEVTSQGGGLPYYFLGHAAFVHTARGIRPGVMQLPPGWNEGGFKGLLGSRRTAGAPRVPDLVDVGARTAAEAAELAIAPGDFVTIPKTYRQLAGRRATARSLDDRVGDSALIAAAWALGPNARGRNITFVWSTGEELGLVGAAAAAKRLAAEGRAPAYVFAIDTFVSSDSPLESPRFADALLGQGFVVRAVDNSNIVPRKLVEKVVRIARASGIPAQYGVTGGGNDGSAFLRYGSADVALGWPLRYSHSPGEVIDTRDLDALSRVVAALCRNW